MRLIATLLLLATLDPLAPAQPRTLPNRPDSLKFAVIGDPIQKFAKSFAPLYEPFDMGGKRYDTYDRRNARFFVRDSNYLDAPQLTWIELVCVGRFAD